MYKRQNIPCSTLTPHIFFYIVQVYFIIFAPYQRYQAVSYTHLFPTLQGRVCKGISLKYIVIGGIDAVSYTHLDVYKRQQNDCTDYILKPVDKEMLLKVLNKVLVLKNEKNKIDEMCIRDSFSLRLLSVMFVA